MVYEDEINPFTGNLPSLRSGRDNHDARDVYAQQPVEAVVDDFNPFTGNLPVITPQREPDRQPVYAKAGHKPLRQEKQQSQKTLGIYRPELAPMAGHHPASARYERCIYSLISGL